MGDEPPAWYDTVMTADEYLARMRDPLWYGEQDENGVDLSLIRELLKLSPEERLRRSDQACQDVLRLQQYGRPIASKPPGADR